MYDILILCDLCFPADGHWVVSTKMYMLLHLSLGSNCWNRYTVFGFFPTSLFIVPFTFLSTFSHFSLFIRILAFSFLLFLWPYFSFFICLIEVNYCRNFSVKLTWLCLDGFEDSWVAAETPILSRFFLMIPSLLFTYMGSFWRLQRSTWSYIWFHNQNDFFFFLQDLTSQWSWICMTYMQTYTTDETQNYSTNFWHNGYRSKLAGRKNWQFGETGLRRVNGSRKDHGLWLGMISDGQQLSWRLRGKNEIEENVEVHPTDGEKGGMNEWRSAVILDFGRFTRRE